MSRLFVPPGLPAKKYLNLATINGLDVGTGTLVYEEGSPVAQRTFKNDLYMASVVDTPGIETAAVVDFSGVGNKMSFAVNQTSALFFEIMVIFNPPNSTMLWTYAFPNQFLNIAVRSESAVYLNEQVKYFTIQSYTAGPFYSQCYASIPAGQTDFYMLASWQNTAGTAVGNKHVSLRVNVIGWAS